jgi:hypothetical protein
MTEKTAAPGEPKSLTLPVTRAAHEHGVPGKEGQWRRPNGRFVPEANISEYDRQKETLLIPMIREVRELSAMLVDAKRRAFAAWRQFESDVLEDYGVEVTTAKGNGTLYTFEQTYRVTMNSSAVLAFDNRLKAAQELISACIADWSKTANQNLVALVQEAFETDRHGMVNVRKILSLRRIEIDDERWHSAMEAIAEATMEIDRAAYLNFYERVERNGKQEWELIPLSMAKA